MGTLLDNIFIHTDVCATLRGQSLTLIYSLNKKIIDERKQGCVCIANITGIFCVDILKAVYI